MTGEQKMKQILSLPESQEEQLQMLAQSIAESLNFEGSQQPATKVAGLQLHSTAVPNTFAGTRLWFQRASH